VPKRCDHGVRGGCVACQVDAEERRRDELARTPEEVRLAMQAELKPIYDEYSAIDEEMRERFKSKLEGRIQRYALKYDPGDPEAAVVRMYRAYLNRRASN
jgi:hypothetical protein